MAKKLKYYDINKLLSYDATYSICVGLRSNGKTYASLKYGLTEYIKSGKTMAYIRRWDEDFKKGRAESLFNGLVENDVIKKLTDGMWTHVYYTGRKWYLCYYTEDNEMIRQEKPFCYGFSISAGIHDKSTSFGCSTIIFDEFLAPAYLPNEFTLYLNLLSTIIRNNGNARIIMLANTVSLYAPYWSEMGITNIRQQEKGTIDLYRYGDSDLTVAVEYCQPLQESTPSSKFFAFNNPAIRMIQNGDWEINVHPHLFEEYNPNQVLFNFFIVYEGEIFHGEIIRGQNVFCYIHKKTTPIKDEDKDLIYADRYSNKPNIRRNIWAKRDKIDIKILSLFEQDLVCYQDNFVGEQVMGILQMMKTR